MPTCLRGFAKKKKKKKPNMIFTLIIEEWMFFPKIKN